MKASAHTLHNLLQSEALNVQLTGLTLLDSSCASRNLFSALINAGISSQLISHFAKCESLDRSYTALSEERRILFTRDLCQESVYNSRLSTPRYSRLVSHYRLNGGFSSLNWIEKHDFDFFKGLYQAVLRGLCVIKRVDICVNYSKDLMPFISKDVRLGCVTGFRSHLRGNGACDNNPFKDQSIGFRSMAGKTLRSFPDFRVDTLYCGELRANNCVILLNNRREKGACQTGLNTQKFVSSDLSHVGTLDNKRHLLQDSTRVKLTLFPRFCKSKDVKLARMLLYTLTLRQESGRGQHVRHVIFTSLLFSRIVFTRSRRDRSTPFHGLKRWSSWYCDLFKTHMSYCTQVSDNGVIFPFNENSMLRLLSNLKADLSPLIDICQKLLFAPDLPRKE